MSRVALPAYASRGDYLTIKHMSDDKGEMPCSLARWRPAAQALAEKLMAERQDLIVVFVFITPKRLRHFALLTNRRINAGTRMALAQALLREPDIDGVKDLPNV
jgi:hypothetical protein